MDGFKWFNNKACGNKPSTTREVLMAASVDAERLIGSAFLVLGCATTSAGLLVLREWSAVGSALATLGLLWTVSGFAMVVSAVWLILLLPLGRQRFPFPLAAAEASCRESSSWLAFYGTSYRVPGQRERAFTRPPAEV